MDNKETRSSEKEAFPNLTEKELERDLINLHLPVIDLIGEDDNDEYLKKLYGEDFLDGLNLEDDEEE